MLGVHLNGSTIACKDADDTTVGAETECVSGGGAGGAVGFGITKWLMVYAGGNAATALTKRRVTTVVEKPHISLSGHGLRFGGGVQCFLTHKLALDVRVQYTMGNFTDIDVAGVISARFRYEVV